MGYFWFPFTGYGFFVEPEFTVGAALGAEDLTFATKTYDAKVLSISGPSFHLGWRL